jgi:hypothetical protein
LLADLFVFLLDVVQIILACVKVMLVLATVETAVVFLYYAGLLIEKLTLLILVLSLLFVHEFATANVASPNSLDHQACTFFVLALPLVP